MLFMVTTEQPALLVMPIPKIKSILSILLESSSGSFITPKLDNVLEKLDEDKAYGSKENNNRTSTNTSTQ